MPETKYRFILDLPQETRRELKRLAYTRDTTMAALVRGWIDQNITPPKTTKKVRRVVKGRK